MTARIVQAGLGDVFAIVAMGQRFHAASGLPVPFSAAQASSFARSCIEHHDGCALVARTPGGLKGMLLAWVDWHPFLPMHVASEQAWWAERDAPRGTGQALLDAFEAWATERGCAAASLSDLARRDRPALRRRGWTAAEMRWMKALG